MYADSKFIEERVYPSQYVPFSDPPKHFVRRRTVTTAGKCGRGERMRREHIGLDTTSLLRYCFKTPHRFKLGYVFCQDEGDTQYMYLKPFLNREIGWAMKY